MTAAGSPPPLTGIADYRLLGRVDDGSGTTNVLYRAAPPSRLGLGEDAVVVLKLLEGTGERALTRLTRLLQTFAAVDDPHLVRLLDAGQHEDIFFYATPDWPRGTLAAPSTALSAAQAAAALVDVCRAAHALHEVGIAHRDISPSTVLLHEHGAWLGGLDLARAAMGGGSVTSMASLHSVAYLDPACIRGDLPSRATDIYSLGATLHLALTGVSVHPGLPEDDPVLAVRRVLRDAPHLSDRLDPEAAQLIGSCLDPDPLGRPATAAELAALLAELAERYAAAEAGR